MSVLSLYTGVYKNIEKAQCHRILGSFGRKPLFHVISRQFKVSEVWGTVGLKCDILREPLSSMPSHFRVFWKEASLS